MARARVAALMVAGLSVAGAVGGCAAPGSRTATAPPAAVPSVAATSTRAPAPGTDWRGLPLAPFGSRVQDLPFAVHEVLLFHDRDAAGDATPASEQECYAPDDAPPRFIGRDVGSYLLCFGHGRLERIEVLLDLPGAGAAGQFAALCDTWLSGTVAIHPRTAAACDGMQPQGLAFSALLDEPADDAAGDAATAPLSMTVFRIPSPDAR